jgi:hypothetical protein
MNHQTRLRTVYLMMIPLACSDVSDQPQYFADSDSQQLVQCQPIASLGDSLGVTDLTTVSDTTVAALFADERRLVIYDSAFQPIYVLRFDNDGPRGVLHPASVAVTDSLIYIADDARLQIRYFDRDGADRGTLRLTFIPRRLRMSAGQLVVAPLVAGNSPAHLLFGVRDQEVVPLGAPIARYEDVGVNTLANMASVAAFPGRFVVMHEMVVPFGYVIRFDGRAISGRRVPLPVPAAERARLDRLPQERLSEKNVNELAVVAFVAAEAPATGGTFYVTRTGNGKDRPFRKIVVELDSLMQFQRAFTISANPHHMAYLSSRNSLITIDADSEWYECPLPS